MENQQKGHLWPPKEKLRELGLCGLREKQQPYSATGEVTTDMLFKVNNSAFLYPLTKEGKRCRES